MTDESRTARLRRKAAKRGLTIHKVPARSRWSAELGPYYLLDDGTNGIVGKGFNLDELEADLA